jgi:outer membrane receptor protein involved in Fe transport
MNSKFSVATWVIAATMAGCMAAPSALAQAAAPAAAPAGGNQAAPEEIVVTAEKRSEAINKVPLSITTFNATQLKAEGIQDTADLAKIVPGFTAVTSLYGSPVYYLRGIGYYDTSVAARPAVTLYADEAPIPYSVMGMGTTLDLERVEVLKGPQGTLFGSNSTGGAINFIAAKPTNRFEAGADLTYGRFDDAIIDGYVSGPLSNDLSARLAVSHEGAGDWQRNYITGQTIGAKDITSWRGTLDYRPLDNLQMIATLSGTLDGSDVQVGQLNAKTPGDKYQPAFAVFPLAPPDAQATAYGNIYPYNGRLTKDNTELQGTFRVNYDVTEDITLTSLSSWARHTEYFAQNAGATTLQINALDRQGDAKSLSEELRANGSFNDGAGHWVFGYNIEHDKTHEITAFDIVDNTAGHVFDALGLPPTNNVPNQSNTGYDSEGVFGNLDYDILDNVTAHGGIRYTDTHSTFASCSFAAGNLGFATGIVEVLNATSNSDISPRKPGDCFVFAPNGKGGYNPTIATGAIDQGTVSWRVGMDWKPVDRTMLYFNVSRGFKAAATSNIAAVFTSQYQPVPEEKLNAYEVGVKTDIIPMTHVNAALFYYDYTDKQVEGTEVVPVFGALDALVSIPSSHVKGGEIDATMHPIDGLTLGAQATYLQTAVDSSFIGTTAFGKSANFEGAFFPNTPKWQTSATAEYTWGVADNLSAYAGTRLTYRTKAYGDFLAEPQVEIGSYTLLDAYVGVKTDDNVWNLQLWGRNITNRYYWTSEVVNQETIVRYTGMPVTYGFTLSYRFDAGQSEPEAAPAAYVPPPVVAPQQAPRSYLVFFDFNKSDLSPQATQIVDTAAKNAGAAHVTQLTVTGHTDTVGSDAYNMRLSRRRAEAVASELEKDGIASSEIEIVAKGKRDLLVPTADGVREPQNRRVQIVYDGGASS